MEDFEQAIQGVLSNPEMMEKIMGKAQALGGPPPPEGSPKPEEEGTTMDFSQLGQLTGLLSQANIDSDQQNLLNALSPYMSTGRIGKLRRAMQAARMAELAGSLLGNRFQGGGNV